MAEPITETYPTPPPCVRCGYDLDKALIIWSSKHMLLVQPTVSKDLNNPLSFERYDVGDPVWTCGECHGPFERVLQVVDRHPPGWAPPEPEIVRRGRKAGLL